MFLRIITVNFLLLITGIICAQNINNKSAQVDPLNSANGLDLLNVIAETTELKGKEAIRLTNDDKNNPDQRKETLAIISGSDFKNGTIEIELSGQPALNAAQGSRGFIGLAFRVNSENRSSYECFYLRPTNGRAEDQLRRNHTTQYVSHPEYPWYRLREENPGLYESYADIVPGEWIKIKVIVSGQDARLFVHDAEQPCLIVKDLKHGDSEGEIALWIHSTTIGYFRNLKVTADQE